MLKGYAFDIDYNLVCTDDTIWIDTLENDIRTPKEISQKQYEEFGPEIKKGKKMRHLNNNIEQSMVNFRGPGRYETKIFEAINQGKFGPSWNKFIEANRYASPIAFITARGHSIEDLKATHKNIIKDILTSDQQEDFFDSMKERLGKYKIDDETLIDMYINDNFYAPCSDEFFLASIGKSLSDNMPARKNAAFEQFVLHTKQVFEKYYGANFMSKRKIRLGFSDDTSSNIEGLHHYIHTPDTGLMRRYPEVLFRMYDTGEPKMQMKFSYKNNREEE